MVALAEDRIGRMQQFSGIDIKKNKKLEVITGGKFLELITEIDEENEAILNQFNCLLFHRSAFTGEQLAFIKTHCEKEKKPLVFFSGGITTSTFQDSLYPFLLINSKDFYSENLKLFMDQIDQPNLLILQFGHRWMLNTLLNIRNDINTRMQMGTIKRIRDLKLSSSIKKVLIENHDLKWLMGEEIDNITESQIADLNYKIRILLNEYL